MINYPEKKHKTHTKIILGLIIFGIFLITLFLLIYTSFSGSPLTGNIIKNDSSNNSIIISADLTIPVLTLNDEFETIIIKGDSDSFLYVGDKKFPLSDSKENSIILTDYIGEISFNEKTILKLEGKVGGVSINGIPMTSKSNKKMKIYFDSDFNYRILEIPENAFIKILNYETSGKIILNEKTTINLDNEILTIEKFYGSLKISDKHFKIKGHVKSLNIKGTQKISVSV
ncbi:MAG: hypothetical protein KJ566_01315 [Nanoarchaeota archaeon]|nr:hypothetical protein [Nanoarchaeota archaeon]